MKKNILKILSKVALLFVIFGFFEIVAWEEKGFILARMLIDFGEFNYILSGLGVYFIIFFSVLSVYYTLILLIREKDICSARVNKIDIFFLASGIVGCIISFVFFIKEFGIDSIEYGFYIIISGFIISLIFLIIALSIEEIPQEPVCTEQRKVYKASRNLPAICGYISPVVCVYTIFLLLFFTGGIFVYL